MLLEYFFAQAMGSVVTNQVTARTSVSSGASTAHVVCNRPGVSCDPRVASRLGSWDRLRLTLAEIANLGENWDGHGAAAIGREAGDNARQLLDQLTYSSPLPAPDITPTASGTIGFAWDVGDLDAYIEIGRTRCSGYVRSGSGEPVLLDGQAAQINGQILAALATAMVGNKRSGPAFAQLRTNKYGIDDRMAA